MSRIVIVQGGAPSAPPGAQYMYSPGFAPVNPTAYALFCAVDTNRSGTVDVRELHSALSNGGWSSFSFKTTRLLMRMFDADRSNSLGYREFEALLQQLDAWRAWFSHADADRSGQLSPPELARCLGHFGFRLAPSTIQHVFSAVDLDCSGGIKFDEFVQVLSEINSLTAAFRRFDPSGCGRATLEYGTFIDMVYATRS